MSIQISNLFYSDIDNNLNIQSVNCSRFSKWPPSKATIIFQKLSHSTGKIDDSVFFVGIFWHETLSHLLTFIFRLSHLLQYIRQLEFIIC